MAVELIAWWRHQMETFSALLALCAGNSPVTGDFPSQRSVMRSFDVFFDRRLNKRLCKQSIRRWFETPMRSPWSQCNGSLGDVASFWSYHHKTHLADRSLENPRNCPEMNARRLFKLSMIHQTLAKWISWCRWALSHYLNQYQSHYVWLLGPNEFILRVNCDNVYHSS